MDLAELTFDNMQPLIGSSFHLAVPERGDIELKIAEINKVMERTKSKRLKRDSFAIYLRGPLDVYVAQGAYPLRHEQLGELTIFMVPVGKYDDSYEYEAIFT